MAANNKINTQRILNEYEDVFTKRGTLKQNKNSCSSVSTKCPLHLTIEVNCLKFHKAATVVGKSHESAGTN